jgi:hypothetical protein
MGTYVGNFTAFDRRRSGKNMEARGLSPVPAILLQGIRPLYLLDGTQSQLEYSDRRNPCAYMCIMSKP